MYTTEITGHCLKPLIKIRSKPYKISRNKNFYNFCLKHSFNLKIGMYTIYIVRNRILTLLFRNSRYLPDFSPVSPDFRFYGDFGPQKSKKSDKF